MEEIIKFKEHEEKSNELEKKMKKENENIL